MLIPLNSMRVSHNYGTVPVWALTLIQVRIMRVL